MAGLYIHIPFCHHACTYCNFHFSTNLEDIDAMVSAILNEFSTQKSFFDNQSLETIYFGGGTPGLLSNNQLSRLMDAFKTQLDWQNESIEITLEVNPENINEQNLLQWKENGINRLSIGVQSFKDENLLLTNRKHTAQQSIEAIKLAQSKGFTNISMDLIYGFPNQSIEDWAMELELFSYLKVPHLSCYALTVEPKTTLAHQIKNGKTSAPKDDLQEEMFLLLQDWSKSKGFIHYEVSNLAIPNHRSQHNSNYWKGIPYLGLGPSAHSFDGNNKRWWSPSNNAQYLKHLSSPQTDSSNFYTSEILSEDESYNEYIMIALRTIEGININELNNKYSSTIINYFNLMISEKIANGHLKQESGFIFIPESFRFLSDGIASDLMMV